VQSPLAALFPEGDYRFHLTLRRAEAREFFAAQDPGGGVLSERARWLQSDPRRYAGLLPEGRPLVEEFAEMCARWREPANGGPAPPAGAADDDTLGQLGRALEPDLLFLSPDASGLFRLRAGVLCFPTGWSLEEKLGHTLDVIHQVVPGLNAALGASIQQFLARLKPGPAFLRDNWGIAPTDELNLHPARRLPPPAPPVALDRLWLRVEHQALVALPKTRGLVFGIRIALHRLDAVVGAGFGAPLRRALDTMPSQLAEYKRLDAIRGELVRLLT
jgi:dimethylamine monooxygenase subunit A